MPVVSVMRPDTVPHLTRDQLRALAEASQRQYTQLTSQIVEIGKRTNTEALFTVVVVILLTKPVGDGREVGHETGPVKTEHLAYHLWPLLPEADKRPFPSPDDIQSCLDLLDQAIEQYVVALAESDRDQGDKQDQVASTLRGHTAIVRGSAFPEQTAEEILAVQGRFSTWFEGKCAVTPELAVKALWAIVRAHEVAVNRIRSQCRERGAALRHEWLRARGKPPMLRTPDEAAILDALPTAKDAYKAGFIRDHERALAESVPVTASQVCEAVPSLSRDHMDALIRLIGLTERTRQKMSHPLAAKDCPIWVFPSGRLLAFCVSSAMDALWDAFETVAATDREFYDRHYVPAKGKWLEEKVADCLLRVFPSEVISTNLRYPDPDQEGGEAELDCLVEWGPFILICEMKSVTLQKRSLLGEIGPLRSSVRRAIGRPFEQAARAQRFIESHERAHFRTSEGRDRVITKSELSRIFCVAVSQHHLGGLSSDLKTLSCLSHTTIPAYPYSVCLADLDTITRLSEVPEVFLHYLAKRIDLHRIEPQVHADEMDLFMAYLETRLLHENLGFPDLEKEKIGGMSLVGWSVNLDVYYQWLRHEITAKPDIALRIPEEIRLLLLMLRERKDTAARWISVSLLGFSNSTLTSISSFIANLLSQPLRDDVFRTEGLQAGNIAICLCGCREAQTSAIGERIAIRTEVEKYRRKTPKAMGVSFTANGPGIALHTVVWLEGPWESDPALEKLSNSIRHAVIPRNQLPDRNELCSCGSGKKFKKCCLRWVANGAG